MNKEKFARELKRVKISSKHAKKAFEWIRGNGERGYHDVWYYRTSPREKAVWAIIDQQGRRYFGKETAALAYLFACQEADKLKEEPPFDEARESNEFMVNAEWYNYEQILDFEWERYGLDTEEPEMEIPQERGKIMEELNLLRQFYQIILYGPPGTGKTYAAKEILAKMFNVHRNNLPELQEIGRWDIVQFHPSYNYEDFVRGVQVSTTKENQVAYKTINKTFGEMCKRADEDGETKYALIIDEINRANVSAVLGELIYALEYRDEAVKTPYLGDLTIPSNLYIIGTMNTADRTIGQIDYAVRRRFAFVHCPPNREIIENKDARDFFRRVDEIFDKHLLPDFDSADVRIGHSYFMAEGEELAYKIIYQVIPILREYVKDGVLQKSAEKEIDEIKKKAEELLGKPQAGESKKVNSPAENNQYEGNFPIFWKTKERFGFSKIGDATLIIVKDYNNQYNPPDLASLLKNLSLPNNAVVHISENRNDINTHTYFSQEKDRIHFSDGNSAIVSFLWTNHPRNKKWKDFQNSAKNYGYEINNCYFVNIGESDSRNWEDCKRYGFVAAGGRENDQKSMENMELGGAVFAYRGGQDVSPDMKKFVAFGQVIETAVRIDKFYVGDGKLIGDCESVKGGAYKNVYRKAFGEREDGLFDYAVKVSWKKILDEDKEVPLKWNANVVRQRINWGDFQKLLSAFGFQEKQKNR